MKAGVDEVREVFPSHRWHGSKEGLTSGGRSDGSKVTSCRGRVVDGWSNRYGVQTKSPSAPLHLFYFILFGPEGGFVKSLTPGASGGAIEIGGRRVRCPCIFFAVAHDIVEGRHGERRETGRNV